jgi:hypothetical protein
MAFTPDEMNQVANYVLNFHVKGNALAQTIQDKPLLKAIKARKKTFPGGKGKIDAPVKGEYLDSNANFFKGFKYDDTVTFQNPRAVLRPSYDWCQIHGGIQVTGTELMQGGIKVVDFDKGEGTANFTDAEKIQLTNLMTEKAQDLVESWSRKFNTALWNDGTQDSGKQFPGITSYIVPTQTGVTTGGLARNTYPWWRNRAVTGMNTATDQIISTTLRNEIRQLRRYGGKPTLWLAGSKFLEALEKEISAKSTIFLTNGDQTGARKIGQMNIMIPGIGTIEYDPTLDDLGAIKGDSVDYSKRLYAIDVDQGFQLWAVDGEDERVHHPARPENQFVIYQSLTFAGGTGCFQLNGQGVYSIA